MGCGNREHLQRVYSIIYLLSTGAYNDKRCQIEIRLAHARTIYSINSLLNYISFRSARCTTVMICDAFSRWLSIFWVKRMNYSIKVLCIGWRWMTVVRYRTTDWYISRAGVTRIIFIITYLCALVFAMSTCRALTPPSMAGLWTLNAAQHRQRLYALHICIQKYRPFVCGAVDVINWLFNILVVGWARFGALFELRVYEDDAIDLISYVYSMFCTMSHNAMRKC